jgi:dynein axonemal intermediate chain 4
MSKSGGLSGSSVGNRSFMRSKAGASFMASRRGVGGRTKKNGGRKEDKRRHVIDGHDVTPKGLAGEYSYEQLQHVLDMIQENSTLLELDVDKDHIQMQPMDAHRAFGDGTDDNMKLTERQTNTKPVSFHPSATANAGSNGTGPSSSQSDAKADSKYGPSYDPNAMITVRIDETPTRMLFHLPSTRVWTEDEAEHARVTAENERYAKVVYDNAGGNTCVDHAAQTFNQTQRHKEVQVAVTATCETGCSASSWDIYDSQQKNNSDNVDPFEASIEAIAGFSGGVVARDETSTNSDSKSQNHAASMTSVGTSSTNAMQSSGVGGSSYGKSGFYSSGYGSMASVGSAAAAAAAVVSGSGHVPTEFEKVCDTKSFAEILQTMEYALVQNEMHDQQELYRGMLDLAGANSSPSADQQKAAIEQKAAAAAQTAALLSRDAGTVSPSPVPSSVDDVHHVSDEKVSLEQQLRDDVKRANADAELSDRPELIKLWTYTNPIKGSYQVTCMDWNKVNTDTVAIGYGSLEFGNHNDGRILLWSIKNPKFPHRVIPIPSSATSLAFSRDQSHLLAVGLYNGSVMIFDIRDESDKPSLQSVHLTGKHSEPVWGIHWVPKSGNEPGEHLTSISSDGTVKQWSMKKGLVPHQIMQLKRIPNLAQFKVQEIDGISRQASGLCFDFPFSDTTQYLAGTEDGLIHKCSTSYNEQTLENFYGHTAPVYRVQCSPFTDNVFISCSADWTAALWTQKNTRPVLQFQSGKDYVQDIRWSPLNSCVFGTVTRDGRVEIWDLEQSTLDPVISEVHSSPITTLLFNESSPVVLAGCKNGEVHVYRVAGIPLHDPNWTSENQALRLLDVIYEHTESNKQQQQQLQQ